VTFAPLLEVTLSKSSYVPVRFDGGPRAGEKAELAGEPRRRFAVSGALGHYAFAWDRDGDGVRQRSGVYTWRPADGEGLVEPTTGDEASALMEKAKGTKAAKDGASISPVPDLTTDAAEPVLADVADQAAELERRRQEEPELAPDARDDSAPRPASGDAASAQAKPSPKPKPASGSTRASK
jgi:hypothetical protein